MIWTPPEKLIKNRYVPKYFLVETSTSNLSVSKPWNESFLFLRDFSHWKSGRNYWLPIFSSIQSTDLLNLNKKMIMASGFVENVNEAISDVPKNNVILFVQEGKFFSPATLGNTKTQTMFWKINVKIWEYDIKCLYIWLLPFETQ